MTGSNEQGSSDGDDSDEVSVMNRTAEYLTLLSKEQQEWLLVITINSTRKVMTMVIAVKKSKNTSNDCNKYHWQWYPWQKRAVKNL